MRISFITWYPTCRRSDTLAAALGGSSHLIHYMQFKQPLYAPAKYVLQAIATWRRLWRERPDVVLVASPPVAAVLAVWIYAVMFRCRYVIDAHTGVFDDTRWTWLLPLSRFLARRAVLTIVTNDHLKSEVESWRAEGLVIGDVPVQFPQTTPTQLPDGVNVVVINTFSVDEPLDEIMKAAAQSPDVNFQVTGNLQHSRNQWSESPPANVQFTGWISDDEYSSLLRAADVVMCLTTHDHTMQRGAYEAMALGKPLITSDWSILRNTFSSGTIHVDNSAASIVSAIERASSELDSLGQQMERLSDERREFFEARLSVLRDRLRDAA